MKNLKNIYNNYIKFNKDENGKDIVEIRTDVFDQFKKEKEPLKDNLNMFIIETANNRIKRAKEARQKELEFCEFLFMEMNKLWNKNK